MDAVAEVKDTEPQDPGEEAMVRAGESLTEVVQEDYFGFDETHIVHLPDGVSYIEHKSLNEGAKRRYMNSVNNEIVLRRKSGDAAVKTAPGNERYELLSSAITNWNLKRGGVPVPFSPGELKKFLDNANPKVVDLIEKDVRLKNPWLLQEMTVEDIDREIQALEEMREQKVKEESAQDRF